MENTKKKIDSRTVLRFLLRFGVIILLAAVVFGAFGWWYFGQRTVTTYVGSAGFWVKSTDYGVNQSATMGAAQMASNYIELVDTDEVCLRTVKIGGLADKWGIGEDEAVSVVRGILSASKIDEESVSFTVYAASGDPEMSYDTIVAAQKAVVLAVAKVNGEEMIGDDVNITSNSYIVTIDSATSMHDIYSLTSSPLKKAVFMALIGLILSTVVCVIFEVVNKKSRYPDVVEEALDCPVLDVFSPSCGILGTSEERQAKADFRIRESFGLLGAKLPAGENAPSVIAVTPATEKYSSNFVGNGLAEALAGSGKRIAVIDCNADGDSDSMADVKIDAANGVISGKSVRDALLGLGDEYDTVLVKLPCVSNISSLGEALSAVDGVIIATDKKQSVRRMKESARLLRSVDAPILGACFVALKDA